MRKPKKPPVKAKGGKGGWGKGRRGIVPHHTLSHHRGKGGKQGSGGGGSGGGSGPVQGWKSGHKGVVPHHTISHHHPAKPPKKRHWSPGWDVECCVAEAVGRILGLPDSDVLELHAASDQTIPGTLGLVSGHARPGPGGLILGVALPEPHAVAVIDGIWWSWGEPFDPCDWPDLVIEEAWSLCAG